MALDQGQARKGDVHFARSAIGGKKTAEVKFRCADELKFELARRAHELGMSESELSEKFIAIGLFGFEHVASFQRDQLAKVASLFPPAGDAK
jgi:hypothetical protein